jgi:hypothetical protein
MELSKVALNAITSTKISKSTKYLILAGLLMGTAWVLSAWLLIHAQKEEK